MKTQARMKAACEWNKGQEEPKQKNRDGNVFSSLISALMGDTCIKGLAIPFMRADLTFWQTFAAAFNPTKLA
jgi:hypothetical protein